MCISNIFDGLNEKQRAAVAAPHCHLLVLAGAGSGKTSVLVHRIVWLLAVEHCSPCSIMAVTFTNKAAEEMQRRIEQLIGKSQNSMWIGTFHGLAHRLLRTHHVEANLSHDFQILDSNDQLRLLKRIINTLNIDEKKWPARQALWYINKKKDNGLRPQHIKKNHHPAETNLLNIYEAYQSTCDRSGLVDFAELLLRAHDLWMHQPDILSYYRERFRHLLVDEFQDTNSIQYAWIRLLASSQNNVMIVGDDDQSIYGWRGAQAGNVQRFLKDFPDATTLLLEQNYRSTSNILKAANNLIAHNKSRMKKNLWTNGKQGEPISIHCAVNEIEEARFVVSYIQRWQLNRGSLNECAILYRSNAQSRLLEEELLQKNIPYRIYGGQRFFERQEINSALAYMRLIYNRNDDAAFEKAINTPKRGIGERTLKTISQVASDRHLTLWQATHQLLHDNILDTRTSTALKYFTKLVNKLANETAEMPLHIQTDRIIHDSGLFAMYQKEKEGHRRIANLKELVTATRQYIYQESDHNLLPLQAFLSRASLEVDKSQINLYQDQVQLMTLHSAKGLEFPLVFIIGMEESLFPSQMSLNNNNQIEEERRLAYVGITRAMQKLTLTYTKTRCLYGKEVYRQPSRFIGELPKGCIETVKLDYNTITSLARKPHLVSLIRDKKDLYHLGEHVHHHKFGLGTIVSLESSGKNCRLKINFTSEGIKWLMATHARLKKL